jgi:molybdopterin synthase catalytic subunit
MSIHVEVLYFATLRSLAGVGREGLSLPVGSTVGDLRRQLAGRDGRLGQALQTALFAVNREFAFPEELLREGDEVAVFPPVSGGTGGSPLDKEAAGPTLYRLTQEPLDLDELLRALTLPATGAACAFSGLVRAETGGGRPHSTEYLEYEAYEPMAQEKMEQVAEEIRARWPRVQGIAIVQRLGHLDPGTPTVLIACTAAHRDDGVFEAARYGIDRLKQIVPIWKKEVGPGGEVWVEGDYHPAPADRQQTTG